MIYSTGSFHSIVIRLIRF